MNSNNKYVVEIEQEMSKCSGIDLWNSVSGFILRMLAISGWELLRQRISDTYQNPYKECGVSLCNAMIEYLSTNNPPDIKETTIDMGFECLKSIIADNINHNSQIAPCDKDIETQIRIEAIDFIRDSIKKELHYEQLAKG